MDDTLRVLRRTWLEQRGADAEARYLRERMRRGELARARVELCAWLGHDPAAQALDGPPPAGEFVDWRGWARALDDAGRRLVIEGVHRHRLRPLEGLPGVWARLDAALEGWWRAPSEASLAALEAALASVHQSAPELLLPTGAMRLTSLAAKATTGLPLGGAELRALCLGESGSSTFVPSVAAALVGWALGPEHTWTTQQDPRSPARAAAHLAQRRAAGELSAEALRLAAYAGHAPARLALAAADQATPEPPAALGPWLDGLAPWGANVQFEATMSAAIELQAYMWVTDLLDDLATEPEDAVHAQLALLEGHLDRAVEAIGDGWTDDWEHSAKADALTRAAAQLEADAADLPPICPPPFAAQLTQLVTLLRAQHDPTAACHAAHALLHDRPAALAQARTDLIRRALDVRVT